MTTPATIASVASTIVPDGATHSGRKAAAKKGAKRLHDANARAVDDEECAQHQTF